MPDNGSRPARGGLTFDAEGQEGGPFHSRRLHVPTASSGLTIGRGYDMKMKSKAQIVADLTSAGVAAADAARIAGAAGLAGAAAKQFIAAHALQNFEISPETQVKLFAISYAAEEKEVRRICDKPDCVAAFGRVAWDTAHPAIRDLFIDLKFRGDYTGDSRKLVQKLLVANNLAKLAQVMASRASWAAVPQDRFNRRRDFMAKAVAG
jgi:hypothetical protein